MATDRLYTYKYIYIYVYIYLPLWLWHARPVCSAGIPSRNNFTSVPEFLLDFRPSGIPAESVRESDRFRNDLSESQCRQRSMMMCHMPLKQHVDWKINSGIQIKFQQLALALSIRQGALGTEILRHIQLLVVFVTIMVNRILSTLRP